MGSPNTATRTGRWFPGGCLGLVALTVLALATWIWSDSRRGWTVARLEASIATEIPADAARWRVEYWCASHGIPHTYIVDTTTGGRSGEFTMPMLAGLRDEDLGSMVCGWIEGREANVGFFDSGRIYICFFFDKEGRLVGHLVDSFIYSL